MRRSLLLGWCTSTWLQPLGLNISLSALVARLLGVVRWSSHVPPFLDQLVHPIKIFCCCSIFLYIDFDFSHCFHRVVRFFFTLIPISHIAFTGRRTFPYIDSDFSHCFHGVVKFSSALIFCFNSDCFRRVVRFFSIHWSRFFTVLSPGGEVFLCVTFPSPVRFFSTLIPISDIAFTGRRRFFSELIPISHIAFTGRWGFSLHWFRFHSLFTRGGEVFLYIDSDFSHLIDSDFPHCFHMVKFSSTLISWFNSDCVHRVLRFFSTLIPISFLTLLSPGGAGWWGFSLHWFWFLKLLSPGGEVFLYIDSDFSHCFHRVVKLFSTLILISQIAFAMQVVKFSSLDILILLRLPSSGGEVFSLYTLIPISHSAFTWWRSFSLHWLYLTLLSPGDFSLHWFWFLGLLSPGGEVFSHALLSKGGEVFLFIDADFLTFLSTGGEVVLYIDSDFSHCFHRVVGFCCTLIPISHIVFTGRWDFSFSLHWFRWWEMKSSWNRHLASPLRRPYRPISATQSVWKNITFRAPAILQIWRNAAVSTTSIRLQVHQILRLFSSTLFSTLYSILFSSLYSTLLSCFLLCFFCTVLFFTLLISTLLFSSILFSSLLFSALLFSSLLYFTLLFSSIRDSFFLYPTIRFPLFSTPLFSMTTRNHVPNQLLMSQEQCVRAPMWTLNVCMLKIWKILLLSKRVKHFFKSLWAPTLFWTPARWSVTLPKRGLQPWP